MHCRALLVLTLLCLSAIPTISYHPLNHLTEDISRIHRHYAQGDTSQVYSTLAKMLIHTRTLLQQMDIPLPHSTTESNTNCSQLLHSIVSLLKVPSWVETYQDIIPKITQLQQQCTNADFESPLTAADRKAGGIECALCSVLVSIMENYAVYHRKDLMKVVEDQFCSKFDGLVKPTCEAFVHYIGPHILKGVAEKETADEICLTAGLCNDKKCRIKGTKKQHSLTEGSTLFERRLLQVQTKKPSPWKWLIDLFVDRFADKHKPPFDMDNDLYSDISTFRGYHWRGSDCNDLDATVYPGRKHSKKNSRHDHDCNGIWGVDQKGHNWEGKLCGNSTRLGVGVIGDSAGAHFSIPEKFFNVSMMDNNTFDDLLPRLADELDIPHESAYTAHTTTAYPSHSFYKHLRRWNLCNNNDYQNLGVNGGDSDNTQGNIKALSRSQEHDHPMLMFLQLVGNDVCTRGQIISPEKFKANIIKLLSYLDTRLPKGSHLVIFGLADGDLLFKYLTGSTHPLEITYDQMYDFLNCLDISPCPGWLNTNATVREATSRAAKRLSKVYQEIIDDGTHFANFDIQYYDFPTEEMFERMYLENKNPTDMIERCDGFHPSGLFHSFLADWLWLKITTEHPDWIGDENPNNAQIKRVFGLHDLE